MTNLIEKFIGDLKQLKIPAGYNERTYSLQEFGDIYHAADAAMLDIVAVLAKRGVYLVRNRDKAVFKASTKVSSRVDQSTDIKANLTLTLKAIKADFQGNIEELSISLASIFIPDRHGFTVYERSTTDNKLYRSTKLVEQIQSILARFDEALAEHTAERDRAARIRQADIDNAAAERAERRAQRQAIAARREANRERRIAIEAEEEELQRALEAGDQETIDKIAQARADRFDADMNARAVEATQVATQAAAEIRNVAVPELPKGVDVMSFIYGWLANNVDYLYAKLPGWDRHAEFCFTNRYPEAPKTDTPREPGYSVTDKDKRTSGGYRWQLANEYHVHFKRNSVQRAPEIVRTYLGTFRSRRTGEASQVKGDISSNTLAQYLIVNLGFGFDKTENTTAYNTCRTMANNKKDFELGYTWTGKPAAAVTASSAPPFDPETEATANPFNQDFPN